jgi:hypothetical protein
MERNLEGVKVKRDAVTLPDAGPEVKCGCRALTSDEVRQYMMQGPGSPTLEQIASQEGNERRVGARQELSSRRMPPYQKQCSMVVIPYRWEVAR